MRKECCAIELVEAAQNDGNFLRQLFNSNVCYHYRKGIQQCSADRILTLLFRFCYFELYLSLYIFISSDGFPIHLEKFDEMCTVARILNIDVRRQY